MPIAGPGGGVKQTFLACGGGRSPSGAKPGQHWSAANKKLTRTPWGVQAGAPALVALALVLGAVAVCAGATGSVLEGSDGVGEALSPPDDGVACVGALGAAHPESHTAARKGVSRDDTIGLIGGEVLVDEQYEAGDSRSGRLGHPRSWMDTPQLT